jgi:Rrf2 family protein
MKLQKATLFALYAVLELAREPGRQLAASEIAEKYGISTNHLAKVLRDLGRAGLVESTRGVGGGYRFSGNAKRTTLLDLVELFERIGSAAVGDSEEDTTSPVGAYLHRVLVEIEQIARATLDSITVETLVAQINRQDAREPAIAAAPVRIALRSR